MINLSGNLESILFYHAVTSSHVCRLAWGAIQKLELALNQLPPAACFLQEWFVSPVRNCKHVHDDWKREFPNKTTLSNDHVASWRSVLITRKFCPWLNVLGSDLWEEHRADQIDYHVWLGELRTGNRFEFMEITCVMKGWEGLGPESSQHSPSRPEKKRVTKLMCT